MPKILYVASVVKTHIMEFHIPFLKLLKDMGWEVSVAARNDYAPPEDCVIPYCDRFYNVPFRRNPFHPGNVRAYRMLSEILRRERYDVIHCHTPIGGALGRLAGARQPDRPKIIYTAHGFHFYRGAPLRNWLLYYPAERWLARKTDVIITINREDYERARNFKAGRVEYIPGVGIDIDKFRKRPENKAEKRRELGLDTEAFLALSVGELIPRKAHALTLEALGELKKRGTLDGIFYVICGSGALEEELKRKARNLGIAEQVRFLGYRHDISEICNCCDLFVFMSAQEGLPVALMEAMACEMPVICSDIRGNRDLIEHGKNGEMAERSPEALADAIERLRENAPLRERYGKEAARTVRSFDLSVIREEVRQLYLGEMSKNIRGGGRTI